MPRVIKRYSNRKCYDTETSRYVNLEDIEKLIRDEVDLQIIDNETQEDVTAIYLSKIIMTQEKRAKDAFTPFFLTQEIQRRSEPLVHAVRKSLQKGTDLVSEELDEGKRVLARITDMGRDAATGPAAVKDFLGFLNLREQRLLARLESHFQAFLKDYAVATRADVEKLERKVDELAKTIEKMS